MPTPDDRTRHVYQHHPDLVPQYVEVLTIVIRPVELDADAATP